MVQKFNYLAEWNNAFKGKDEAERTTMALANGESSEKESVHDGAVEVDRPWHDLSGALGGSAVAQSIETTPEAISIPEARPASEDESILR